MSTEHVEELIATYALGGLSREERQSIERHLAGCESCRALAAEALGTVRLLPFAAEPVTPAPATKLRLMARVQADLAASGQGAQARNDGQANAPTAKATPPQPAAAAPRAAPPARPRTPQLQSGGWSLRFRWAWASAAMAVLLALVLGWWGLTQQSELASARAELELLSRPDLRMLTIPAAKQGQSGQAKLFVSPDSTVALLTVNGLPPLPPQQTYEFWLIRGGQPRPAGIFNTGPGGSERVLVRSADPLGQFDQAGITVEKAGGSQTPTLDALVVVGALR